VAHQRDGADDDANVRTPPRAFIFLVTRLDDNNVLNKTLFRITATRIDVVFPPSFLFLNDFRFDIGFFDGNVVMNVGDTSFSLSTRFKKQMRI
jgi:hypothetical protein